MPAWLEVVLVIAVIVLAISCWCLHLDVKRTEGFLEMARNTNARLSNQLKLANQRIEELGGNPPKKKKIPPELLADDPMEAFTSNIRIDR